MHEAEIALRDLGDRMALSGVPEIFDEDPRHRSSASVMWRSADHSEVIDGPWVESLTDAQEWLQGLMREADSDERIDELFAGELIFR